MPPRSNGGGKVRQVGSKKVRTTSGFNEEQLLHLCVLLVAAIQSKIPFYVGSLTTTGSIKLRFYDDDVPSQAYVSSLDDVWEEIKLIGTEVLGEEALSTALGAMASWRLQRGSEPAPAAKPKAE